MSAAFRAVNANRTAPQNDEPPRTTRKGTGDRIRPPRARSRSVWSAFLVLLHLPALAAPVNTSDFGPEHASLPAPQPVVLSCLEAADDRGRVLVRWETVWEWGVISYDLLRQVDDHWVRVNPEPVLAVQAMLGGRYHVRDATVPSRLPQRYRLEAFLSTGQTLCLVSESLTATAWQETVSPTDQGSEEREAPHRRVAPAAPARAFLAGPSVPVDLPRSLARVKLRTSGAGLRFVSAAEVAGALNQPVAVVQEWLEAGQVSLSNRGQAVAYVPGHGPSASGGSEPGFFFYAEAHRNNYTADNAYFLGAGSNPLVPDKAQNSLPSTGMTQPAPPSISTAVWEQEVDQIAIPSLVNDPEQDFWMWQGMNSASSLSRRWLVNFELDHLARAPERDAVLEVRLFGGSDLPHRVRVSLNGVEIGVGEWTGRRTATFAFQVASTALEDFAAGEGRNTLAVVAELSPAVPAGVTADQVYSDGFRVRYPRHCYARAGMFEGEAEGEGVMTVTGFRGSTPPAVHVFEVTDPRRIRPVDDVRVERDLRTDVPPDTWQASFRTAGPAASRHVAVQSEALSSLALSPGSLRLVPPPSLSDPATRASYVVIAPDLLADAAARWAAYRDYPASSLTPPLRTKVVRLEAIFDEFSHGLATPDAIRSFLRRAYEQWAFKPRYALLVGDGTLDYRNLRGYGENLVPPLLLPTPYGLFASDSRMGDVFDDGVPRVAIGRLPIRDAAELEPLLAKVTAYERGPVGLPLRALLVADRPDAAGDFVRSTADLVPLLAPRYRSELLRPLPYPVPGDPPPLDVTVVQSALQTSLNQGLDLLNYVGHGAVDRLGTAPASYLKVNQGDPATFEPALLDAPRVPLFLAMTCVVGQYASPGYDGLAEALVRHPHAGVIASLAPSGLSQHADAIEFNQRFAAILGQSSHGRLGDVLLQSFAQYQRTGARLTPLWIYSLLGDPALTVHRPPVPPSPRL